MNNQIALYIVFALYVALFGFCVYKATGNPYMTAAAILAALKLFPKSLL